MKIGFFEVEKWQEDYISKNLKTKNLEFYSAPLNIKNFIKAKDFDIVVCFIYSELNSNLLRKLSKLKAIATMSTGFDHIDLNYCKKRGIKVCNVPSYGENTVAEFTFALILALLRRIHKAIENTRDNNFSLEGLKGLDLKGKTLGVIGPGNIGQHVIKIAKGFEMKVIAHGVRKDNKLSKKLGFSWVSLDSLLSRSDIITIHVPLLKSTRHLINMKNIKKINKGSYLINTSRGEIVDTTALLYALEKGIIAGAGLDVLEGEEDIKEHTGFIGKNKEEMEIYKENRKLLKDKDVLITPHSAFFTKEALERILDTTIINVKGFLKGRSRNSI